MGDLSQAAHSLYSVLFKYVNGQMCTMVSSKPNQRQTTLAAGNCNPRKHQIFPHKNVPGQQLFYGHYKSQHVFADIPS